MNDPTRDVRLYGIYEGISFLVLLGIAMPLKYFADMPVAVRIAGSIHGSLFVAYVLAVWRARERLKWSNGRVAEALIASLLPFGPFYLDRKLRAERDAMAPPPAQS